MLSSGGKGARRQDLLTVAVLTPTLPGREHLLAQCVASVKTIDANHLIGHDIEQEGPGAVRNKLALRTDAEWLLPLDDDDLIDPDYLNLTMPHTHDADVVYSWCRVEDHAEGLEPWTPNRLFTPDTLLLYNYVPVTALIRHTLWDKVGGMPAVGETEDWRMWLKCLAAGARFRCVDQPLWTYRRGIAGSRNEWVEAA